MSIDKKLFKDEHGRYLTQGLFFEFGQKPEYAIFTIDGEDKKADGNRAVRDLISLKKRYLEAEDPLEYTFANEWLYDWEHWQRLCGNKLIRHHIDKWREELQIKLRSNGFQQILDAAENGDIQAIKFVSKGEWESRVGRPSKAERERRDRIEERIHDEFLEDVNRLKVVK